MRAHAPLCLILAAGLAACGGSNDPADSPATEPSATPATAAAGTDPCTLVTTEEMAAAIGEKVTGTEPADGGCRYLTEDADASSVTIELDQADAAAAMKLARDTAGVLGGLGAAVAGEGGAGADVNAMLTDSGAAPKVGDEAFFGPNSQLSVRKGDSYIAVSPPTMRSRMSGGNPLLSGEQRKAMAVAIAEKAVSRLP